MLDLLDIKTNDTDITKYRNEFLRRNKMMVTKDILKSRNVPDVGSIPISSEGYINESMNNTKENFIISCLKK